MAGKKWGDLAVEFDVLFLFFPVNDSTRRLMVGRPSPTGATTKPVPVGRNWLISAFISSLLDGGGISFLLLEGEFSIDIFVI